MSDKQRTLHISPVGENWEVESEEATLGQADTKPEAVEMARELASGEGASSIEIHTSDGQVVEQIDVELTNGDDGRAGA
jgi:hypothetical protein